MAAARRRRRLALALALLAWLLCARPSACRGREPDRRFAEYKRCADPECSMLMCRGKAVKDFKAPDCRFLDFKEGESIYVYYKLTGRTNELWAGSETPSDEDDEEEEDDKVPVFLHHIHHYHIR